MNKPDEKVEIGETKEDVLRKNKKIILNILSYLHPYDAFPKVLANKCWYECFGDKKYWENVYLKFISLKTPKEEITKELCKKKIIQRKDTISSIENQLRIVKKSKSGEEEKLVNKFVKIFIDNEFIINVDQCSYYHMFCLLLDEFRKKSLGETYKELLESVTSSWNISKVVDTMSHTGTTNFYKKYYKTQKEKLMFVKSMEFINDRVFREFLEIQQNHSHLSFFGGISLMRPPNPISTFFGALYEESLGVKFEMIDLNEDLKIDDDLGTKLQEIFIEIILKKRLLGKAGDLNNMYQVFKEIERKLFFGRKEYFTNLYEDSFADIVMNVVKKGEGLRSLSVAAPLTKAIIKHLDKLLYDSTKNFLVFLRYYEIVGVLGHQREEGTTVEFENVIKVELHGEKSKKYILDNLIEVTVNMQYVPIILRFFQDEKERAKLNLEFAKNLKVLAKENNDFQFALDYFKQKTECHVHVKEFLKSKIEDEDDFNVIMTYNSFSADDHDFRKYIIKKVLQKTTTEFGKYLAVMKIASKEPTEYFDELYHNEVTKIWLGKKFLDTSIELLLIFGEKLEVRKDLLEKIEEKVCGDLDTLEVPVFLKIVKSLEKYAGDEFPETKPLLLKFSLYHQLNGPKMFMKLKNASKEEMHDGYELTRVMDEINKKINTKKKVKEVVITPDESAHDIDDYELDFDGDGFDENEDFGDDEEEDEDEGISEEDLKKFATQLEELKEKGFEDVEINLIYLKETEGDVEKTIEFLQEEDDDE